MPRQLDPVTTVVTIATAACMAALLLTATAAVAQPAAASARASAPAPAPVTSVQRPRAGEGVRWGRGVTPGWSLMTPRERAEHRARMQAARTAQECRDVMAAQRDLVERRAQSSGRPGVPLMPHHDPCSNWRRRG